MKVLIAEDDRMFQIMLAKSLEKWGYEVVTVSNGEDALRELQSKGGPRFAILDWMMPKVDGLEVCRQVRSARISGYVYIILLTANQGTSLIPGFEAGVDDYLFKPINLDELRLRLRAGRRVLEAGQWYRSIAETASDGIVIVQDKSVVFANSAAEAIFGFGAEEMLGREFSSLVSGVDLRERSHLESIGERRTRGSRSAMEIPARHRSGRDIILEVSVSEFAPLDQDKRLTVLIRDVTQRKTLEMQREQAHKMESIGQLAAGVAHEINTPIQYIGDNIGFLQESYQKLEMLLNAYGELSVNVSASNSLQPRLARIAELYDQFNFDYLKQEVPRAIAQSLEGVEQVASIVATMREFSAGSPELTSTDLNHLIEGAVVISKNGWKYVAELQTDLDRSLPPVVCAPGELRQVLLNLIVNAADAITDAINLGSGQMGMIRIASRWDGEMAEIRVSDTGTGIPEAIRAKVFDPFFTTKEVGKGSGQGLALAYTTIVKRHAGSIELETEVGVGTTFLVRLPIGGAIGNGAAAAVENYAMA